MNNDTVVGTHQGVAISLTGNHKHFKVTFDAAGADYDHLTGGTFPSYSEAVEHIDAELLKLKPAPLNLKMRDGAGRLLTVRGIHAGHGAMLFGDKMTPEGLPALTRFDSLLYPDVPWVVRDLAILRSLADQYRAVIERLDPVGVKINRDRDRFGARGRHPEKVAALKHDIAAANETAKEDPDDGSN